MNKIQTLLATLLLLFGISGSGAADFNDGYTAYKKGDYKIAFNELKPLAEEGHTKAQYTLGNMYRFGQGVLQDDKEAAKWLLKAAEQGYVFSYYDLGNTYREAKGDFRDYRESFKWFYKSATEGDDWLAQLTIGKSYAEGKGVLKDLVKAKYWVKKSYENQDAYEGSMDLVEDVWNKYELWKY